MKSANRWEFIILVFDLDNAGDFFSDAMAEFCARNGIHLVPTPAYRQAFNGVAEVFIKILMHMARPMIATALLPAFLWCICVEYACRIRNLRPRYPAWTSPNQRFDGTTTDVNTLHIWGCLVIAHINRAREDPDLSDRGEHMRFVGTSHTPSFAYLYKPGSRHIYETEDITWVETNFQDKDWAGNIQDEMLLLESPTLDECIAIDSLAPRESDEEWQQRLVPTEPKSSDDTAGDDSGDTTDCESVNCLQPVPGRPPTPEVGNPQAMAALDICGAYPDTQTPPATSHGRAMAALHTDETPSLSTQPPCSGRTRPWKRSSPTAMTQFFTFLLASYAAFTPAAEPFCNYEDPDFAFYSSFAAFEDPLFHKEAMRSPEAQQWQEAMDDETDAFTLNHTWEIVDIKPWMNLLSSKCTNARLTSMDILLGIVHA
jgi:hypothetical protein